MVEFITRCCHAEKKFEVIFKTDREATYKVIQGFARGLIDAENATTTLFDCMEDDLK